MLLILFSSLALALENPPAGETNNPLENPGFEYGAQQWSLSEDTSIICPEAAHGGKMGLRLGSLEYNPGGAAVFSARFPVAPQQEVTIRFWAKTQSACSGAYIWFSSGDGKLLIPEGAKGATAVVPNKTDNQWHEYIGRSKAPAGTVSVCLWLHSFAGVKGQTDYDDFVISGLEPGVKALPMAAKAPAKPKAVATAPDLKNLPPRKTPAVIILKFDDVKQVNGDVSGGWKRLATYLEKNHIKGSFGVICQTLQDATPAYIEWFKQRQQAGMIEFWFHGFDHGVHTENGKAYNEFNGRGYDQQKKRMDDSQKLAQEKLGFAFETFGPPGGVFTPSFNDDTCRVMQDDPHMKVWLYPQPIDAAGKKLEAAGKVTILDRVWEANLEATVGVPDSKKFIAGYMLHPEREYFVLQGHPAGWGDDRFAEFVKIIDFLTAQKAVFMTPSEYAASRKK